MHRSLTLLTATSASLFLLACGGIWGDAKEQAAIEYLTTARGKVEACTGEGRAPGLAAIDAALGAVRTGSVDVRRFLSIEAPIQEAVADGEISVEEAAEMRRVLDGLTSP